MHDGSPEVVFDDQELRLRMRQQFEVFGRAELVIERNHDAAAVENGVGGNQPFRLVGHDDRRPVARVEVRILQGSQQTPSQPLKIRVGEPQLLAVAIRLDEASLVRTAIKRIAQGCAQTRVLRQVQHEMADF